MFQPGALRRQAKLFLIACICLELVQITGCSRSGDQANVGITQALRLATTTSTRDSGLLDQLLPEFERQQNCRVDVIAVGTGAALTLGEAGDVDVLLVHARRAEDAFMQAGYGTRHEEFMYNEFVLLGPEDDPAHVRGRDPVEALKQIAQQQHLFVSRGDDSGTHKREMSLWELAGVRPTWDDYLESGQGMGPTLVMADEKQGYVLADIATYLKFQQKIELVSLVAPARSLRNPYAAIVVKTNQRSKTNALLANAFVDFLISKETQQLIAAYRVSGRQLFLPTRLNESK